MLLEVVLALERLAARLAREGDVVLVGALVDHEVVRLGEAALAVLADELALGAHLAPKLRPPLVRLHLHDGEHGAGRLQGILAVREEAVRPRSCRRAPRSALD